MTSSHQIPPQFPARRAGRLYPRPNLDLRKPGTDAFVKPGADMDAFRDFDAQFRAGRLGGGRSETCAPGRNPDGISDAEIAQLVSVSLESALLASGERDPERFLELRACRGRDEMRAVMQALPRTQARDPMVLNEYRKAVLFQNVALDLSLALVNAIKRYSRAVGRKDRCD